MSRLHSRIKHVKVWILFLVLLLNKPAFCYFGILNFKCRISISVYLECENGGKKKHVINIGCLWEKQSPFSYHNPRYNSTENNGNSSLINDLFLLSG